MPGLTWPRLLAVAVGATGALAGAAGLTASRAFAEPTPAKYATTVAVPLFIAWLATTRKPLRACVGAAAVVAPVDFVTTLSGVAMTPLLLFLGIATGIALTVRGRGGAGGPTLAGTTTVLAVALLLPALAIGVDHITNLQWLATVVVAGWVAHRVASEPGGLRFVLAALAIAATVQAGIAIWEWLSGSDLNLYRGSGQESFDQHYFFSFGDERRPRGAMPDPIALGNLLALACPLVVGLGISATGQMARLAWAGAGGCIALALVLTLSRMSWVGATAGLVIAILLLPGHARWRALAATTVIAGIVISFGLTLGGRGLNERFASLADPTASTIRTAQDDRTRIRIWDAALQTAAADPIAGTGFGRLPQALGQRAAVSGVGVHAHSWYLQLLAEAGALGAIALILGVGGPAIEALRRRRLDAALYAGIGGALVTVLVTWTTDSSPRYAQVAAPIAFMLGAAAGARGRPPGTWARAKPGGA